MQRWAFILLSLGLTIGFRWIYKLLDGILSLPPSYDKEAICDDTCDNVSSGT